MNELPTLAEAGVWASIFSSAAAAAALAFNARALRAQSRSSDAATLFKVVDDVRTAEARLTSAAISVASADAKSEELCRSAYAVELNNYLNLLEMFAAAVNWRLFGRATLEIATTRLQADLNLLLEDEDTRQHIECAVTSEDTFSHLAAFRRRHRMK